MLAYSKTTNYVRTDHHSVRRTLGLCTGGVKVRRGRPFVENVLGWELLLLCCCFSNYWVRKLCRGLNFRNWMQIGCGHPWKICSRHSLLILRSSFPTIFSSVIVSRESSGQRIRSSIPGSNLWEYGWIVVDHGHPWKAFLGEREGGLDKDSLSSPLAFCLIFLLSYIFLWFARVKKVKRWLVCLYVMLRCC